MSSILEFLQNNFGAIVTVISVMVLVLLLVKKQYSVFIDVIMDVEEKLNSESGQKKLDMAVALIQSKLPVYIRVFITKKLIVTIIEYILNGALKHFKHGEKVDIKGNED